MTEMDAGMAMDVESYNQAADAATAGGIVPKGVVTVDGQQFLLVDIPKSVLRSYGVDSPVPGSGQEDTLQVASNGPEPPTEYVYNKGSSSGTIVLDGGIVLQPLTKVSMGESQSGSASVPLSAPPCTTIRDGRFAGPLHPSQAPHLQEGENASGAATNSPGGVVPNPAALYVTPPGEQGHQYDRVANPDAFGNSSLPLGVERPAGEAMEGKILGSDDEMVEDGNASREFDQSMEEAAKSERCRAGRGKSKESRRLKAEQLFIRVAQLTEALKIQESEYSRLKREVSDMRACLVRFETHL